MIKATLKVLQSGSDARSVHLTDSVIRASSCISSLDDAIRILDAGVAAVVLSEEDLQLLFGQVRHQEGRKKAYCLIAGAAAVVDSLGSLVPRLYNPTSSLCGTSTEATFQELRELARITSDTATRPGAQFGRNAIRQTGRTLYAIVAFLRNLRQTFDGISNSCNSDMGQDYTLAISTTFDDLADLMGVPGSYNDAEKIRKGAIYVALALEDKGVRQISQELGIKLDFLEVDFLTKHLGYGSRILQTFLKNKFTYDSRQPGHVDSFMVQTG